MTRLVDTLLRATLCCGLGIFLTLAWVRDVPAAAGDPGDVLAIQGRLDGLLRRGNFDGLDRLIETLQGRFDRREINEDSVVAGYLAFAPAPWDVVARLDAWVARAPAGYPARLARGLYYFEHGMLLRGRQRDEDVGSERLAAMRESFGRSTRDLQAALAVRPRLPAAWRGTIAMAAQLRDSFEISHSFRAALAAVPDSTAIRLAYAHALWRLDLYDALARFADETLARRPAADARFGVFAALPAAYEGLALVKVDDIGAALERFDAAIARFDWPWARVQRGLALLELGRADDAERDFREAIRARPWTGEAFFWLGSSLMDRGKADEGRRMLDRAVALDPMNPTYRTVRASYLADAGDTDAALRDIDAAMTFGHHDAHVHAMHASVLMKNDPRAALRSIDTARRLDPDTPNTQLIFVNALYATNDCAARSALTRYVSLCRVSGSCGSEVSYWDAQIRQMRCQAPP